MKNSQDKNFQHEDNKDSKEDLTEKNMGEKGNNEIKDLEDKLEKAKKEAQDNLEGWQRAKADFMNYKKDQEKAMSDFRKYANEDIIMALLPTVDSFDLAAKHMPEDLKNSDWAKGVLCIKGMFENFLRDSGVTEIKAIGEKFDPQIFEAVGEEESEAEEDTVIAEVQKGYKMGDKVIRPAKVKVAKKMADK